MKHSLNHHHQGFVILFVVLIASIILLIGAGIFTISLKQNILSSTAKESQLAFTAADTAVECALYYDQLGQISVTGSGIDCADQSISVPLTNEGFIFDVSLGSLYGGIDNMPCAQVVIDKNYTEGAISYTQIIARGYNVCDQNNNPAVDNPTLLERVLEVKYPNPITTGGTLPGGGGPASPTDPTAPGGTTPVGSTGGTGTPATGTTNPAALGV